MSTWVAFFAWPGGGVWSNLVASAIWTVPALAWHHRRMKQHINAVVSRQPEPVKESMG
jgi:hypothetical protein